MFIFLKNREETTKYENQIAELRIDELKVNQIYEKRQENNKRLQDIYNDDKKLLEDKIRLSQELLDSIDSFKSDMESKLINLSKKQKELNQLKLAKEQLENRVYK